MVMRVLPIAPYYVIFGPLQSEDAFQNHQIERNERRRRQGKIAKKHRKKTAHKPKKQKQKKTLPFKSDVNQETTSSSSTSGVEEQNASLVTGQERERRETTIAATRQSEERSNKVIRGKAANSLKRRALTPQMDDAVIPLDEIFGDDPKKPWSDHPKFHSFLQKAASYVDNLGFSSPSKGQSETMHSLARKLNVQLEAKKQPSKKILVQAIVITKLKQLDPVDARNYQ